MIKRRLTKAVNVGGVLIGGGSFISIQSMTTTDTRDVAATAAQINALAAAGCEVARVAVPDKEAAEALKGIKRLIDIPLVADVHFDYRLALLSIQNGADKLRINPGNIGGADRVAEVAALARQYKIPIRVGANGGSLDRKLIAKHGGITAEALAESCMENVRTLEAAGFDDIVLAVKSSNVPLTIAAYELLAERTGYPLHVGITESGAGYEGAIKSAAGIGAILSRGIGDTIRVSLTGDPLAEIKAAKEILKALGLRRFGAEIISCPTCGRTKIDLVKLVEDVHKLCDDLTAQGVIKDIKVAVMGCAVNGPGEAREADVGVAGGDGRGVIFRKGEIVASVDEGDILAALEKEMRAAYE